MGSDGVVVAVDVVLVVWVVDVCFEAVGEAGESVDGVIEFVGGDVESFCYFVSVAAFSGDGCGVVELGCEAAEVSVDGFEGVVYLFPGVVVLVLEGGFEGGDSVVELGVGFVDVFDCLFVCCVVDCLCVGAVGCDEGFVVVREVVGCTWHVVYVWVLFQRCLVLGRRGVSGIVIYLGFESV